MILPHLPVFTLERHQLLVAAPLGDPTLVEHQDQIRVFDRRHSMSDDERGAPLNGTLQMLLDKVFRLHIHR